MDTHKTYSERTVKGAHSIGSQESKEACDISSQESKGVHMEGTVNSNMQLGMVHMSNMPEAYSEC
ncbi:hypothetical protein J1N35_041892 [Gossypium stocksii]|uniref:Uncharacterized protein n=1 Tax=Gossypium stocksii TaxID=47602 RepID=A0A9D3UGR1_9ROSI|nr:hypothetical protein J1N35_041892 [Gossypium stocksii]